MYWKATRNARQDNLHRNIHRWALPDKPAAAFARNFADKDSGRTSVAATFAELAQVARRACSRELAGSLAEPSAASLDRLAEAAARSLGSAGTDTATADRTDPRKLLAGDRSKAPAAGHSKALEVEQTVAADLAVGLRKLFCFSNSK